MEQRPQHKKKIMVVDDLREVTGLIKVFLSSEYEITVAHDGSQALQLIHNGYTPDAILTDLNMPGLDGYMFIRELQQDTTYQGIPVVVFSVVDKHKAAKKLSSQRVAGFVTKTTMSGDVFKQLLPMLRHVTSYAYAS
jgi:CheY-like chemotaxis protein